MNRRALQKLLEENNARSPDIPAVTVTAENVHDACTIAEICMDISGKPFPFNTVDHWVRELRVPAELYFPFQRKTGMLKFVRLIRKELPTIHMLF